MDRYKIVVIAGSLRRDSFNQKLAGAIAKLAPPTFSFEHLMIGGRATTLGIPLPASTDPRDGASPTGLARTLVEEVVELTRPRIGTSLE